MDRLKVAMADKVLELSSESSGDIRLELDKIHRFSDFAEACRSLMGIFPDIEAELLEMVTANDFDTTRASRRVDAIIHRGQPQLGKGEVYTTPQIPEEIPIITPAPDKPAREGTEPPSIAEATKPACRDEDPDQQVLYSTVAEEDPLAVERKARKKRQLTLLWQLLVVAAVIFVIIVAVKFVLSHWKVIVIVLGSLLLIYLLLIYLRKRYKSNHR